MTLLILLLSRFIAYPCPDLNIPVNGARVCNGWKTDFGRFCQVYCEGNYSLSLQYDHSQWYVCGSSGNWIASGPLPNCTGIHHNLHTCLSGYLVYRDIMLTIFVNFCVTACVLRKSFLFPDLIITSQVLNSQPTYRFKDCADSQEKDKIQLSYIDKLKTSNYNYFCDNYGSLCERTNVDVACWIMSIWKNLEDAKIRCLECHKFSGVFSFWLLFFLCFHLLFLSVLDFQLSLSLIMNRLHSSLIL